MPTTTPSNTIILTITVAAIMLSLAMAARPVRQVAMAAFASGARSSSSSRGEDGSMPTLPPDVVKYSQVPKAPKVFTADTIPRGLLKEHTTKAGTWGIINVSRGKLEYQINSQQQTFELSPNVHGVIVPTVLHQVKPLTEDVEFVVEFYRLPGTGPVDEKREGLKEDES